jgi:hypothetical protein
MAYGNGMYVTVGVNEGTSYGFYSKDFIKWNSLSNEPDILINPNSIVFDSINNIFVCVGYSENNGKINYSVDGSNWSNATGNYANYNGYSYNSIVATEISPSESLYIVVGRSPTVGFILTSSSGNIWGVAYYTYVGKNLQSIATDNYGTYVILDSNGGDFIGYNNKNIMYSNSTCTSWTDSLQLAFNQGGTSVTYGDGVWVAVGSGNSTGNIFYSTDASNWYPPLSGEFVYGAKQVIYSYGRFVAIPDNSNDSILYSLDGSNWSNGDKLLYTSGNLFITLLNNTSK